MKRVLPEGVTEMSVGDSLQKRLTNTARGAALVEMALVLPLMILLFLIAIDLGLVLREYQILQNAAREGARFSAQPANWVSPLNPSGSVERIQQYVSDYLQRENITINLSDVYLNQSYPIDVIVGDTSMTLTASEVRVSYTRSFLVAGAPLFPSNQLVLTGKAVFQNFY